MNIIRSFHGTVLIIAQQTDDLMLLSKCLSQASYRTLMATDGGQGITQAQSALPDLVLLDLELSDIDGLETFCQLQTAPASRDIPVIFLPGFEGPLKANSKETPESAALLQGLERGGVDYIPRPFHPAEVLARIRPHVLLKRQRLALRQEGEKRKQDGERLKECQAKFRCLFDRSDDAIFVHDYEGRFIDANHTALTTLGYSLQELNCLRVQDVDPHFLQRHDPALYWPALQSQERIRFETHHCRKDGTRLPVEVCLEPISIRGQSFILSVARDLSARKAREKALLESEARLKFVFDGLPMGLCLNGTGGEFVMVNSGFCQISGYASDELLGLNYHQILYPDDQNGFQRAMEALLNGKMRSNRFQARHLHKNGSAVMGAGEIQLIRDESGDPRFFFIQVRDSEEGGQK